jgi:hypothetical protein
MMDELRRKKKAASQKVKKMKSATGQTWEDLKCGTEAALEKWRRFSKIMNRFK